MARWPLFVTALVSFAIYGHAIGRLFSREHGVDRRMKALQLTGTVSAVAHLWAIATCDAIRIPTALLALALYGLAMATFFAARRAVGQYALTLAFSPDQPQRLLQTGIYARIRHPFYTAYMLTWLAGMVSAPGLITGPTTLLMFAFYWQAARLEEEKFEKSALAATYASYRARAGMFWPSLRPVPGGTPQ